jgi:aconitate hydratase
MLALTFVNTADYDKIRQDDSISILGFDSMEPGKNLEIQLQHADGTSDRFEVGHSYNQAQIDWVKWGSALNQIRAELNK